MARIRSIHPGLLTDEAFMTLTVECPLAVALLIGLWMEADDAGTFEWKPLTIKARILPAVSTDVGELLGHLERQNFVRRFDLDGKAYGVIRNFVKYQRPKSPKDVFPSSSESKAYAGFNLDGKRPNAGTGRPPGEDHSEGVPNSFETGSGNPPQMDEVGCRVNEERSLRSLDATREERSFPVDECSIGHPDVSPDLGIGARADDDARLADAYAKIKGQSSPLKPSRSKIKSRIAGDAQPTKHDALSAQGARLSTEEFRVEWRKFRDHHLAVGSQMADWSAAWRTWLGRRETFSTKGKPNVKTVHDAARELHAGVVAGVVTFAPRPPSSAAAVAAYFRESEDPDGMLSERAG